MVILTLALGIGASTVQLSDPVTMGAVLGLMTVVATAASYLPARRAARVDPVTRCARRKERALD